MGASAPVPTPGDLNVASGRHKQSVPASARVRKLGVPAAAALAVLATILMTTASSPDTDPAQEPTPLAGAAPTRPVTSDDDVSRSGGDRTATPTAEVQRPAGPAPTKTVTLDLEDQWLTEDLNVWTGPGERFRLLAVLDTGKLVEATGVLSNGWAQIRYEDSLAWVNADYLADEKPEPEPEVAAVSGGLSSAPCSDGSSIESGLTSNSVSVYRAVCAAFPAVSTWGGLRPGDDGDHGTGQALDIMVYSNSTLGQQIADYVQANASALGVSEILWSQHIWSVERASEGWRWLEDRGSVTANHYDHVHVSVY